MRRVSSRQRLVSWDAFDANVIFAGDNDSSTEDQTESGEGVVSISDYATALEMPFRGAVVIDEVVIAAADKEPTKIVVDGITLIPKTTPQNNDNDIDHHPLNISGVVVGRKRDRRAFRGSPPRMNIKRSVDDPTSKYGPSTLAVPTIVPSYSWEVGSISQVSSLSSPSSVTSLVSLSVTASSDACSTEPCCTFDDLMDDVHIAVFSFLDLPSIRSVMAVSHHYRQLMLSADARSSLWMKHCQDRWHLVIKDGTAATALVDSFRIPMAATLGGTLQPLPHQMSHPVNLPLLLSMTPKDLPTEVDQDLVQGRRGRRHGRLPQDGEGAGATAAPSDNNEILFYNDETTGLPLVRYNGAVGSGDRCIRSDHALPRPSPQQEERTKGRRCGVWPGNLGSAWLGDHFDRQHRRTGSGSNPFFNLLCRGANKVVGRGDASSMSPSPFLSSSREHQRQWRPFVIPFVDASQKDAVNITPRLVSYFEVSILDKPKEHNDENDEEEDGLIPGPTSRTPTGSNDCVAVGVATESFHVHSRMPGWDRQSFGYHGDDGGIFHSSGGMVKRYGPTFAAGDTVGCGVDYVEQGIFYTLNGQFLGYAWTGIDEEFLKNDLFPVVGLDTSCPLHLNFGGEAFHFDLASFLMKHKSIISPLFRFSSLREGHVEYQDATNTSSGRGNSHSNRISNTGSSSSNRSNSSSHRGLFQRRVPASSSSSSSNATSPSRRSRRYFGRRRAPTYTA
jgi:hypothetical protein